MGIGDKMRDRIKDEEYFGLFIEEDSARVDKLSKKIEDGEVRPERIIPVKQGIFRIRLGILIAKNSRGDELIPLKNEFIELYKEWAEKFFSENAYNENLRMISLSILFGVDEDVQESVRTTIVDHCVDDWLLHCLLGNDQSELTLLFPKRFHTLKEITNTTDKTDLLRRYLLNEWYNKEFDCYEAHKNKQNIYYGYWCFEAAAIAKTLNLDDGCLKDEPYYPYDLVHFNG